MNVRDLPASRSRLRHVAGRLRLSEEAYARAREAAGLEPDPAEWRLLLDRFLSIAGVGLVIAGVTAFFAYNWAGLHPFAKFGLIQAGIVASVTAAWIRGLEDRWGRSALFTAAFLVGVLFAVYGQVYQTGADPYTLFFAWAVLVVGWAWIGRQAALWMLVVVLLDLALILYWTQVLHPRAPGLGLAEPLVALGGAFTDARLGLAVFALNAAALVVWEWRSRRGDRAAGGRSFPRGVAVFAFAPLVASSVVLIALSPFDQATGWNVLGLLFFVGSVAWCLHYYRRVVPDLFILTTSLLGAIMVITTGFARMGGDGYPFWMMLAALIVAQTTGAAVWLRNVAQGWEETS